MDGSRDFKELVLNIMLEAGKPNMVDYFPALRSIDPQRIRGRMSSYVLKVLTLFGQMIDKKMVMKTFLRDIPKNDALDVLLKISQEDTNEINKDQLVQMCMDFFVAGTDTTSSTLEWAMTELLRHPTCMKNAKNELKRIVCDGKQVEESDIDKLPYLQAIIKETMRMHPPAPFLIPRQVYTEIDLCGYTIPKGAQVLVNVWAIGRDPDIWESPMEYKPERFIDSKIDLRGQDFELIPFGAGRRICP
ncbi:geraniol 8-hydroxylase-like [Impatiens glandulifera]|uniref:geraniol 8-hydroxylase-like n=1 Tax=Impatiens glandulifera TaxID=253017 RepID=UPI001FB07D45|nr:geraniol 8-hydroxylase-like [Impatiens glandulifera]